MFPRAKGIKEFEWFDIKSLKQCSNIGTELHYVTHMSPANSCGYMDTVARDCNMDSTTWVAATQLDTVTSTYLRLGAALQIRWIADLLLRREQQQQLLSCC